MAKASGPRPTRLAKSAFFFRCFTPNPPVQLVLFFAVSAILLALGYRLMGRLLVRVAGLEAEKDRTPAHARRDGLDYEPAR